MFLSPHPNSRKKGSMHNKPYISMDGKIQFQWKTSNEVHENWQSPVYFLPVYLVEMVCMLSFFFFLGKQIFLDPLIFLLFGFHLSFDFHVFFISSRSLLPVFTKFMLIRKWKISFLEILFQNLNYIFNMWSQKFLRHVRGFSFGCLVFFSGVNKHLIISLLIYQIKYTLIKI